MSTVDLGDLQDGLQRAFEAVSHEGERQALLRVAAMALVGIVERLDNIEARLNPAEPPVYDGPLGGLMDRPLPPTLD